MNFKKINQAVSLQMKANYEMDTLGQASKETVSDLDKIIDSFTEEEANEYLMVYQTLSQEELFYIFN